MKSVNYLKGLPVVAVLILTFGAQVAIADHHEGDHVEDKNNNVKKTFPVKDGQGQTNAGKTTRKLDTKQSGKKRADSNSGSTKDGNSDSTTIGKGTGNPESTKSGSGTGYSGPED
jgi:hypothetical protein